ncbi:hypothetical protein [Mucilaginibacter terrae]|uniref:Uncharacterized protein n=1 Tax=Mucilaginibacter terrae TaxID=1955052 RepID=A0ABU3GRB3_9SPHI|nr:hypothetical protein [Mucilaginibacter terrae]MDT3402318.1 hypothetical protein [Mucilaginibacter terrae]
MKTQKEPVIYMIEGTSFEVDVAHQLLRQTNDRGNTISFTRDMQDKGTHYQLQYDLDQRKAQPGALTERTKLITVPQMAWLDPEGMAQVYGKKVEEVMGRPDYDIIVDAGLVVHRHQGVLPMIDIGGEPFIVDIRSKELRQASNLTNRIPLRQADLSATGDEFLFFYHLADRCTVELDPKLTAFPDQVVLVKVPNEVLLDPIATAEACGLDVRQLLRRFPIRKDLKATLVPLADTGVPGMISRNRLALQREHAAIMASHPPKKKLRIS